MDSVLNDDSYHVSERMMAEEVRDECEALMGRNESNILNDESDEGWKRYD